MRNIRSRHRELLWDLTLGNRSVNFSIITVVFFKSAKSYNSLGALAENFNDFHRFNFISSLYLISCRYLVHMITALEGLVLNAHLSKLVNIFGRGVVG